MELERRKNAPFKMAARLPTRDTEIGILQERAATYEDMCLSPRYGKRDDIALLTACGVCVLVHHQSHLRTC